MAKQIIILGVSNSQTDTSVNFIMWFPVTTVADRVPRPNTASAWSGASAAEIADLQSGAVVERQMSERFPSGTTAAQIKALLEKRHAVELAAFQPPGKFQGIFFDSVAGWSA